MTKFFLLAFLMIMPSAYAQSTASGYVQALSPAVSTHRTTTRALPPSLDLSIPFPSNTARLSPEVLESLKPLGEALQHPSFANTRFRIESHTDTIGSRVDALHLTQIRAQLIRDHLVAQYHLSAQRLEPVGMGQESLAVRTQNNVADIRNRRVVILNQGAINKSPCIAGLKTPLCP